MLLLELKKEPIQHKLSFRVMSATLFTNKIMSELKLTEIHENFQFIQTLRIPCIRLHSHWLKEQQFFVPK